MRKFGLLLCFLLTVPLTAQQGMLPLAPLADTLTPRAFRQQFRAGDLYLQPSDLTTIRQKLAAKDPVITAQVTNLRQQASAMLESPLLDRNVIGRRLLGTSHEALRRITTLALLHQLEPNPVALTSTYKNPA
ncbi:MAG: hypothetical protein AAFZ52_05715 [Bacteroidota bacterium]